MRAGDAGLDGTLNGIQEHLLVLQQVGASGFFGTLDMGPRLAQCGSMTFRLDCLEPTSCPKWIADYMHEILHADYMILLSNPLYHF